MFFKWKVMYDENIIDVTSNHHYVLQWCNITKLHFFFYRCTSFSIWLGVFETHPPIGHTVENFQYEEDLYPLMRKLEECFLLFHRNTRFFIGDKHGTPTGHITEFQNEEGFLLQLKYFGNEISLAKFMFNYGELYFVNKNFL